MCAFFTRRYAPHSESTHRSATRNFANYCNLLLQFANIIEISNLNKSFGDVKAVQDLSFRVKKGELFAFLGLNGAGKSTTISIMCGQLAKDIG